MVGAAAGHTGWRVTPDTDCRIRVNLVGSICVIQRYIAAATAYMDALAGAGALRRYSHKELTNTSTTSCGHR